MVFAAEPPALLWNSPTMDSSRMTSSLPTRLLPPTSLRGVSDAQGEDAASDMTH